MQIREFLRMKMEDANGIPMTNDEEVELINSILEMEDQDKDGYISHTEFSGTKHDEF